MAFSRNDRTATLTVGRVTHTIKADTLLRIPSDSILSQWIPQSRQNSGCCPLEQRDGHAYAYIWHYLTTGDLIYPLHEGFRPVDVLLQELSSCGLADDVMRTAQEESKKNRRETSTMAIVITTNSSYSQTESEHRLRRKSDTSAFNINSSRPDISSSYDSPSHNDSGSFSFQDFNKAKRHSYSASTADLNFDRRDKSSSTGVRTSGYNLPPSSSETRIATLKSEIPERFLSVLKRYLRFKNSSNSSNEAKSHFDTENNASGTKRPVAASLSRSLGVFRPRTSHGTTLILLVTAEDLTVFGHRMDLEHTFPGTPLLPIRTSSVLINCQIFIENPTKNDPKKCRAQSWEWALAVYHKHVSKAGFHLTVHSEWRQEGTVEKVQQWICHKAAKRGYNRSSKSRVRKKSILTKFFNKDEL